MPASAIDISHTLWSYHEHRNNNTDDFNNFRRWVGRNHKNTRHILRHIHQHIELPATVDSFETIDEARNCLRDFQQRLDILE